MTGITASRAILIILGVVALFVCVIPQKGFASSTVWNTTDPVSLESVSAWNVGSVYAQVVNPNISITYAAQVTDGSGNIIGNGGSVPCGTNLNFQFGSQSSSDIYWFGTGGAYDSPYGDWVAGAGNPGNIMQSKNYFATLGTAVLYVALSVNPPSQHVDGLGSNSCSSLGGGSKSCTMNSSISSNFVFDSTFGHFYIVRYAPTITYNDGLPAVFHSNGQTYTLQVPTQSIPYNINVTGLNSLGQCAPEPPPACVPNGTYLCNAGVKTDSCGNNVGTCTPACVPAGINSCSGTNKVDSCGTVIQSCASSGLTCSGGACVCVPNGTYSCSGTNKIDSCGTVVQSCSSSGLTCTGGACVSSCTGGQAWNGSSCVCPSGTSWNGSSCVSSCTGGQTWNGTSCVCPSGTSWNGSSCVSVCSSGTTWNGTSCVSVCSGGQTWNGTSCVCPSGTTWNGVSCIASCADSYFCQGSDLMHQDTSCVNTLIRSCTYGCSVGACLLPTATISFSVTPLLVRKGETSQVVWSTTNTTSCRVTSTNGASWTGTRSTAATPACTGGSCTSPAIQAQTIFTLRCISILGPALSQTATVSVIPTFCEPGSPGC